MCGIMYSTSSTPLDQPSQQKTARHEHKTAPKCSGVDTTTNHPATKREPMRYQTKQRKLKAEFFRDFRSIQGLKLPLKKMKELGEMQFGRPTKETLGEHWPVRLHTDRDNRCLYACTYDDDGTAWRKAWLLDGEWDDEDIMYVFNICEYYRGPGLGFAHSPHVERSKHSTLVIQFGGLDV